MPQNRRKKSEMGKLEDNTPAEAGDEIRLESSDENRETAIQMINNCRRHLDIISRDLDPCIFDTSEMLDAFKKLALRSRSSRIRILVMQPESVISRGHRLLDLSERLSSFIEIRKPAEHQASYNKALLLVDDSAYIQRKHADRFEGIANFNDRKTVSELDNEFELLWEQARPDPDFRRLMI